MESSSTSRKARKASRWTLIVPLLVILALIALYFTWPEYRSFWQEAYARLASEDPQAIRDWISQFGAWSVLVIILLALLQTIIPILPSLGVMVASVLAFGPWQGGTLAWFSLLGAASLAYALGRAFGPVTIDRLIGQKTEQKIEGFMKKHGTLTVIAARLSPALSTDAVSIVAGLVRMNFWRFIGATAFGTLPLTILVAWLAGEIDRLESGLIWISVLSLSSLAIYLFWDHRKAPPE